MTYYVRIQYVNKSIRTPAQNIAIVFRYQIFRVRVSFWARFALRIDLWLFWGGLGVEGPAPGGSWCIQNGDNKPGLLVGQLSS
jgi:hypothetical protein